MNPRILLFVPVYNCENKIVNVIESISSIKYIDRVIFVDNGSIDSTREKILDNFYLLNNTEAFLLHNKSNYNLGGSHKVAFNYLIENNFDYIIVLHGDDQGNISDIDELIASTEYKKYDCLLGSRFSKSSKLLNYSFVRILGNRIFNLLSSFILKKKITDLGAGLNMFSRKFIESIPYWNYPDDIYFNYFVTYAIFSDAKFKSRYFSISWSEDDQKSNVKYYNITISYVKLNILYLIQRKKFIRMYRDLNYNMKNVNNYHYNIIKLGSEKNK